jgi:hypothetical protein
MELLDFLISNFNLPLISFSKTTFKKLSFALGKYPKNIPKN